MLTFVNSGQWALRYLLCYHLYCLYFLNILNKKQIDSMSKGKDFIPLSLFLKINILHSLSRILKGFSKMFWRMLISLDGEGNGTPLQYSCLENAMDGGDWWAAVHGITESGTPEWLHFHFSLSCIGEGNGNPLQCSFLENPRDRGAWWAAVYRVAQSQTRLKRLSSSSSRNPDLIYLFWILVMNISAGKTHW